MKFDIPEGAREAVEELASAISVPIDEWLDGTDKSESFQRGAIMCALTKVLVTAAIFYGVPAEVVLQTVVCTLDANGAFDGDDDEVVH
jgi:hypothetical protein